MHSERYHQLVPIDDHVEPLAEYASLQLYEARAHIQVSLTEVLLLFNRISFFLKRISFSILGDREPLNTAYFSLRIKTENTQQHWM